MARAHMKKLEWLRLYKFSQTFLFLLKVTNYTNIISMQEKLKNCLTMQ